MIFRAYASRGALVAELAGVLARDLRGAIAARGRALLSVPGGSTPGPLFDALSQMDLDWARVAVVLNDERWVDETSERSNTRLLRARLVSGKAAAARIVPLHAPGAVPEDRLAELAEGLRPLLPIDVLLLGMGGDMHTASLFPGADRLTEGLSPDAPVLLPMRAEAAGEPRITLTAPVLTSARDTHIMITGQDKRQAILRAATLSAREAPVALVLPRATVHWAE